MFDADVVKEFWSVKTLLGVQAAAIFLFVWRMWNGAPAMFAQWIAYRRAKAEEKASNWSRLNDENSRLDSRCQRLEIAEEKCREELSVVKQRLSALEGYQAGYGHAFQEASGVIAIERNPDLKDGE